MYASHIFPTFNHGYLATYELDGIAVYAPDGALALRVARPAGSGFVNVDIDLDGSVVVAVQRDALQGGVALFNRDGSKATEIVTDPYLPDQVCFGPDHSIWVLGDEDLSPVDEHGTHFLLRHYSRAGQLLGSFLPRSSFPADADPGAGRSGFPRLRIANDRVGATLYRAGANHKPLLVETNLDGKEVGRWTVPLGEPSATTASGIVYAAEGTQLTMLDRATGSWISVPNPSHERLLGADGDDLVFAHKRANAIRRAKQP